MYVHAVLLLFLSYVLLAQPTLGTDTSTANITLNVADITNSSFFIAKRGCQLKCGDITVPYPFGFGKSRCYNSWLNLTCNTSSDPPKLHLGGLKVISISQTQVRVQNPVAVRCYNPNGTINYTNPSWMTLGKGRTFSDTANKFTVVGCNVYALISWWNEGRNFSTGCLSVCSRNGSVLPGKCTGIGCCQIDIPKGLQNFNASLGRVYSETETEVSSPCSYAFLGEQDRFEFKGESDFRSRPKTLVSRIRRNVPVVIDFVIGNQNCSEARNSGTWLCLGDDPLCTDSDSGNGGYRCTCKHGYEGNPYLSPGCKDIDECNNTALNNCHEKAKCTNTAGSFNCTCRDQYYGDGTKCTPNPKDSQTSGIKLSLGKLKLNTDGCFYESTNKAGYGGVLRDSSGKWVLGYYGKATGTSSLEVEIWAIYRGLTVILDKGISSVILESDSSVAVNFCNEGPPPDHPQRHIIEEVRRLAGGTNSIITHIYRQANQTADCLARLGSQQEDDLIVTSSIPFAAREFALADAMGVGHLRT